MYTWKVLDSSMTISVILLLFSFNGMIGEMIIKSSKHMNPNDCETTSFFDTQTFSCKKCPNNLVPSNDKLQCVCGENSKFISSEKNITNCESCPDKTVLTSDGISCIPCDKNGSCQCEENEIALDRNFDGTPRSNLHCQSCPQNSVLSNVNDESKCLPCSRMINIYDYERMSIILRQRIQKYCWPEIKSSDTRDETRDDLMNYQSQVLHSYYLRMELSSSIHLCKKGNTLACEHLGHMCALTLQVSSYSCRVLDETDDLKKIFYIVNDTRVLLTENQHNIPTYSLLQNKKNDQLELMIAKYSLKGKFQSISKWKPPCSSYENIRFGINVSKSCKIFAKDLLNSNVDFSTLYLSYVESDSQAVSLLELPILVKYKYDDMDTSRWQLMRKFFMIDNISGYKVHDNTANLSYTKESELSVLRFVKSLTIEVRLQGKSAPGKIFLPLIVIEYGELMRSEIIQNTRVLIEYRVTFTRAESDTKSSIQISIIVLTILSIIYAGFKTWRYSRINVNNWTSVVTYLWFIIYSIIVVGNSLVFISIGVCVYTFLFYKGQTVLDVLLPDGNIELIIRVLTIIGFGGKIVEVMSLIYHLRRVNIFFIDWEESQKNVISNSYESPHTSTKKSYKGKFDNAKSVLSSTNRTKNSHNRDREQHDSVYNINKFSDDDGNDLSCNRSVSVWRTYFIANEWLRIKVKRKTNILFQVFMTLIILEILEFKNWSIAVPEWTLKHEHDLVKENFTLKYAVGALIYMLTYMLQWILSTLYEKYVKNSLQEFVDLCTMANISIFLLSHDYYGHYIHGRSVHGFADKDLVSLLNDLEREENNLCAHRGLIPGTTDQTFIIYVTKKFRSLYNAVVNPKNTDLQQFPRRRSSNMTISEVRYGIHLKLRKFLCCFLDNTLNDVNYTIKEKSFIEKMCGIEFERALNKSIFYMDRSYSFSETFFHGNEWTLATLELVTFVFVLVLSDSYILSLLCTIFVSKTILLISQFNQYENLANQTWIDKRFFM